MARRQKIASLDERLLFAMLRLLFSCGLQQPSCLIVVRKLLLQGNQGVRDSS